MEADDLLCSRNARLQKVRRMGVRSFLCSRSARPQKEERGAARPSFLLAERARSECARSARAVKDSPATPLKSKVGKVERASLDGRSRKLLTPVLGWLMNWTEKAETFIISEENPVASRRV